MKDFEKDLIQMIETSKRLHEFYLQGDDEYLKDLAFKNLILIESMLDTGRVLLDSIGLEKKRDINIGMDELRVNIGRILDSKDKEKVKAFFEYISNSLKNWVR